MVTDQELVRLLKQMRALLRQFLELTNENQMMLAQIKKLRDLLNHDHLDLRQYLRLEDKDREQIGIVQQYYAVDTLVQKSKKYLSDHEHAVELRLETLRTYRKALEKGVSHLEGPRPQHQAELTLMPARRQVLAHEYHNTIHEAREMRQHFNYLNHLILEPKPTPDLMVQPEYENIAEIIARFAEEYSHTASELSHIEAHEDQLLSEYAIELREMIKKKKNQPSQEDRAEQSYRFYPRPPVPTLRPTSSGEAGGEQESQ